MLNLSTRDQFKTLLDAVTLTSSDASQPALIFVQTGEEPITLSQQDFQDHIATYASALRQLGINPKDLVVIAHVQNLESIFAFWGALLIGAVPSMFPSLTEKLDPEIYMANMSHLVEMSDVKMIFTTDDFAPQLSKHVACTVCGTSELLDPKERHQTFDPYTPEPDEIALLQHSSGTTGLQKGVALSHEAVLNQLASYSDVLKLTNGDVVVSWLPLYHDMGLIAGFLLPLIQGIPLVIISPFDWVSHPALLFRAIDQFRGTLCWLPNFAYNHCARRIRQRDIEGLSLGSIRAFINCSEPVRYDSHQLFLERFGELGITSEKLTVSYAMAENVFAVTQTVPRHSATIDWIDRDLMEAQQQAMPVGPDDSRAVVQVSCGPPIPDVEVQVLGQSDSVLPERKIGEIAIRSNCLLTEYYHRPDLQPFTPAGWYRTGDMGYIAGGEIYIVGRSKDLIINAGKNVYPQDIEAIINTVPGVHPGRTVVFGVSDKKEGTELIAAVAEITADSVTDHRQIERLIRQQVSQQSTVTLSFIQLVDDQWLIKTSSGKIARAANRQKWLQERQKS